jgi:uncharacterized protein (TIGR00303 family)
MAPAAQEKASILEYVHFLNDPYGCAEKLLFSFSTDHRAAFLLCNAGTKASDEEGISAAGSDPAARRLTPALDAEALLLGKTISAPLLPVSPAGIVSPVVISRACLALLKMEVQILNCGSFQRAALCEIHFSDLVADCPASGAALPEAHVHELFEQGMRLGTELARQKTHLVLAECVPGGTTTALAVLTALGFAADGLVSTSLPAGDGGRRRRLVSSGLERMVFTRQEIEADALLAVAALGDPMQACVCGIALSASESVPVFLAGGSQMLAVFALLKNLSLGRAARLDNITIMTTKWVSHDPGAGVVKLARLLEAPLAAATPDFYRSRWAGLRAYEEGHVKEGAGAGACLCLARAAGFSPETIMAAVDACYAELTGKSDLKS